MKVVFFMSSAFFLQFFSIQPSNVFFSHNGRVKVGDFGLATASGHNPRFSCEDLHALCKTAACFYSILPLSSFLVENRNNKQNPRKTFVVLLLQQ